MKTKQFITVMLIALIFGTVSIQAQSARRAPHEKKEQNTETRTSTRKDTPQKARNVQAARQVQKQPVTRQKASESTRNVQATRQVQKQPVTRQKASEPTRNVQAARQVQKQPVQRSNTTQPVQKPVSMSTPKNPRSTYRKPNTQVYANHNQTGHHREDNYSAKRYFSGNHYHYVYPTRKVKFHYHHDTYLHNYRVLYYPAYTNIYWTRGMYRDYSRWYPGYRWNYNFGYRINTISAFDAKYNLGEVAMVYGRVYSSWYNDETDDYLLFFGGDYPYQQFTVVLPGPVARRFSWRPERYFLGEHITVTGLITTYDGIPEIIVKHKRQLARY